MLPEADPQQPTFPTASSIDAERPPAPGPDSSLTDVPGATGPTPSRALTADEQMALFEQDLKESDWGHQPC